MPIRNRLSLALLTMAVTTACAKTPPAPPDAAQPPREPPKVPPMTAFPHVYWALVAADLDAVTRAKTPADHHALAHTVFVPLGESARVGPARKARPFIVAREAVLNVSDDGVESPPRPFTAFPPGGSACTGKAERRIVLDDAAQGAPPDLEKGVVLEGCPPPPNTYAMFVVEGAHPDARKLDGTTLAPKDRPGWALGSTPVGGVHRFEAREPLFVVVRDVDREGVALSEVRVGSLARLVGTTDVPRDFEPPTCFLVGEHTLVVVGGAVLGIAPDKLVRVQEPTRRR